MLKPVPFTKARAPAPRLSAPRITGRHSDRFWTEAEDRVMRETYGGRGPAACLDLLPGKNLRQISARASRLGLKSGDRRERGRPIGDTLDDAIKQAWPGLAGRGALTAFANGLGVERHVISRRALALGLTLPHRKEPPWTEAEEALLRRAPVNDPRRASEFFAAHGYARSPAAIVVRCKRLAISRRPQGVLSANRIGAILGLCPKVVTGWADAGEIEGERRGTRRLPQQGGDTWSITPAALRRFILANLDRIDIRKVDKHAFVAIIAGGLDDA